MTNPASAWRVVLTVLLATVAADGSLQAQSTGSPYPYRATAPLGYWGSRVTIPVPQMSPSLISNAARSAPTVPGTGSLGGGYVPPSITSLDLRLPQRENTESDTKAHIWLHLPDSADVWVNGVKTQQTGETRYYYSPPLIPGKKYSYQMRIRWMKDGKPAEQTQTILVQAGETIRRDFTRPPSKSEPRP